MSIYFFNLFEVGRMVKGKYVAMVEIDFDFDENAKGYPPFEKIRENLNESTDKGIRELIQEDVDGIGMVKVHRQIFVLYQVNK